jgi:transcriptional regulator GlxA family with amidase domain
VAELFRMLSTEDLPDEVRHRCEQVILDLLRPVEVAPMVLPMPADPRLLAVARTLLRTPDDGRSVQAWADELAMSVRHFSRRFAQETGMTFDQWRLHARVRVALGLLAQGVPVATVGRRVGYSSASAFVQAFSRVMGHTPGWYQGAHAAAA